MEKGLLTVGEAAAYLSCGRTKLFSLFREGDLRVVKLGRATRVPRAVLTIEPTLLLLRRTRGRRLIRRSASGRYCTGMKRPKRRGVT